MRLAGFKETVDLAARLDGTLRILGVFYSLERSLGSLSLKAKDVKRLIKQMIGSQYLI